MKRLSRSMLLIALLLMLLLASCGGGAPAAGDGDNGAEATEASSAPDALVITPDMVGQQIEMKLGEQAVVKFDPAYNWRIVTTPSLVLAPVADAQLAEGEQALLEAKLNGNAVIQATGRALCKDENPPCDTANQQLTLKVKVSP